MKLPALLLVITCSSVQAQFWKTNRDTALNSPARRDDYIREHPDHFFLWPLLKQRTQNYELEIRDPDKRTVGYYSNKPYSFGIGLYLFELSAEIAFAIPLNEKAKRIYGESSSRNLQLNLLGKRWLVDAYWQRYEGFYIKDSEILVPANTPYLQRPDIRTQNIGLNVNRIFNYKKFSFRAAYNFSERQLKSAGSLMVVGSFDNFRIAGDSALLGKEFDESFSRVARVNHINSFVVGAAPGYTHTLVYENFFINGTLAVGPAVNWLTYTDQNGEQRNSNKLNSFHAVKVSLGYNGERLFGGMTFSMQSANTRFDHVNLTSSVGSFKILAGYRILERGILKKRARDLQKSIIR